MKRTLKVGLLILPVIALGYWLIYMFILPDKFMKQIYLVPRDAIFIVETNDPIGNWKDFSSGEIWNLLKEHPELKEVNQMTLALDSTLHANKAYLDLLGKRQVSMSAHMTEPNNYDFLFIVDLEKLSKLEALSSQFDLLMEPLGFTVKSKLYKGHKITELYDPKDSSSIYISFVDNHLLCSFTLNLIHNSINEREDPMLGSNQYFVEIAQQVNHKGMAKFYINYDQMPRFIGLFTPIPDPAVTEICSNLNFTGLDIQVNNSEIKLQGSTGLATNEGYLPAFLASGHNTHTVSKVLSNRTAFMLTLGFDNTVDFMNNLEKALKNDPKEYTEFKKNWDLTESLLKIDIKRNFLSWIDGEVVFAQNTPGELGKQNEFVVALRLKNKTEAINNLQFIEKQIRKRTPVKFKTVNYQGYDIHYIQMKGFFKLLFGKLFDRLEKPYYTIIDDFVIFSNSPATLLSTIEDYRLANVLNNEADYVQFRSQFSPQSSVFVYCNMPKFFPLWKDFLSAEAWKEMQANEIYFSSFTQTGFQLDGLGQTLDSRLIATFNKNIKQEVQQLNADALDFADSNDTITDIQLFYLEKMQGNIFTEFYDNGALKSQTETKKGIRHGKHKTFFENGKLKCFGRFKNNKKHGTWRYYLDSGKLERKEKWNRKR